MFVRMVILFAVLIPTNATAQDDSVTVYDKAYLSSILNAVTALDLAIKTPGGQVILGRADGGDERGFASNDDGVLINGQRLSGKNNSSEAALSRISASQVLRIEIIRGSSPDIKISSQEAMMNVVLVENESRRSVTFDLGSRILPSGRFFPLGSVSLNGSEGPLDYFLEVSQSGYITDYHRNDEIIDNNGRREKFTRDEGDQYFHSRKISTNLSYQFQSGDQLRLNASIGRDQSKFIWNGAVEEFGADGNILFNGNSALDIILNKPTFEISGDYTGSFSNKLSYKMIGLYLGSSAETNHVRDALVIGTEPIPDSDTVFFSDAREIIFRPSLSYAFANDNNIETGNEIALNNVEAGLNPNDLVTVKEARSESFINFTYKVANDLNIESALKYELSKITQESIGRNNSETFSYLKPSIDLRYDLNPANQLQFSARREVSQLNFNDFASSIDDDDILIGGNQDLVPEKSWVFETSFERRFTNDQGHVRFGFKHERISDHIDLIEVAPGIAGVGNVGNATKNTYAVSTSLKFGFIGLQNVVLDGKFEYFNTKTLDAFTLDNRAFNDVNRYISTGILRHDLDSIGVSYNFQFWYYGPYKSYSVDQFTNSDHDSFTLSFSVNYKIFNNMILTLSGDNLLNVNEDRMRTLYSPTRLSGLVSSIENRDQFYDKRFRIRLKGTF